MNEINHEKKVDLRQQLVSQTENVIGAQWLRRYRLLPVYFREICIKLASSSYQVSNTLAYDRFDEKSYFEEKGQGPNSQQGSLFANPLAATLQSPCLLPYTGPIDLRVTLSLLITSTVVN
ncbi:hypothetical protein DAPPUDRAFT_223560 [Daphnia pulex]|uniref:Uncharacterized protein n=1 Tax=Daphnia pulex TaxID=6669 RepID=E9GBS8_DAPPU|nr:hypothetical protein DAPPUDRAFT_223560 [Daphnia pulex]|eukprot:EFX83011.1 hypothetical protein DAPPUDRAFT_223560 [Daphnia pulex]